MVVLYRFYEAQMSGEVPAWSRASQAQGGWRNWSHTHDGFGPDGIGMSLSGGWYDAGDHLKISLPLGVTASMLSYGMLTWESTYRSAGQWDLAVRNLDWVASYLIKCHVNASDNPADNAFVAQAREGQEGAQLGNGFVWVGDGDTDHNLHWGRPEQQAEGGEEGALGWRPVYLLTAEGGKGADIVSEAVAAMVGTALVLRRPGIHSNPAKAQELLRRATQLFEFAKLLPGMCVSRVGLSGVASLTSPALGWWSPPAGRQTLYGSARWRDDLAWAAAWLCRAAVETGVGGGAGTSAGSSACAEAASLWIDAADTGGEYGRDVIAWAAVFPLASMMLRDVGAGGPAMVGRFEQHISYVLDRWISPAAAPPCNGTSLEFQVCYTPGGLAWYSNWGSARCAANMAMAALMSSRTGTETNTNTPEVALTQQRRRCWAWRQASYLLGGNSRNQSFVVGYAPTPYHSSPTRPVHKSSSCPTDYNTTCDWTALSAPGANPSVLYGALVGGPDQLDGYQDSRGEYVQNEVALDYNAGFTGAMAGLIEVESLLHEGGCSWEGYCVSTSCGTPGDRGVLPAPATCPAVQICVVVMVVMVVAVVVAVVRAAAIIISRPINTNDMSDNRIRGGPSQPPPQPPAPPPPPSPPLGLPSDPSKAPATCRPTDAACRSCLGNTNVTNTTACSACVAVCAELSIIDHRIDMRGRKKVKPATRCLSDWRDARAQCFDCVTSGVTDAVSCAECAKLPTAAARAACMTCQVRPLSAQSAS
ncbi:hypothetical protein VOLCADRAFT_92816 [Volvox carteri f. nagariensis]|uniref:Endoglucanase n=1 Tax=Volvox carteri f. nagariensis TaxID=3068 RepID=D8U0J3_VOLCA|nr:uncharacterized protein VOLCADRAFT_92816 [Volvox carteri f. nagariensis]EFJ46645.1 hypothetical protein VOLCADRAFT_92816 [Volvox carteri f. nagariensis]|eukprot:XP_002952174.1 hypothetical protein VOLCADRAFT_92816 [Volvox carteri f. nagariensis]